MTELTQILAGLRVVDLGLGMAPALVARMLADMGAEIVRFEPAEGDPFYARYPAYAAWRGGATIEAVETVSDAAIGTALELADICLLGGEDWPGLDWKPAPEALSGGRPRLILLDIAGYPDDLERPAHELLVQARSGVAFEQFSARPIQYGFAAASFGAAQQGMLAVLAALCAREQGGEHLVARTSLYEGAVTWAASFWYSAEKPGRGFDFAIPKDPYALIFRCRDGRYIHFVLGSFGSKGRLYRILQIDDPSVDIDDSGTVTGLGEPKNFFGDIDVLSAHVANFDSGPLLEAIQAAGIAAEYVLPPGACWADEQVAHLGLIRRDEAGYDLLGLPVSGIVADKAASPQSVASVGGPLAGKRVLDFGLFVAGPFGSVALSDLGADVIKVETLGGDPNRNVFRSFAAVNRGKRSIAIDMKTPQGREIVDRLIAGADIVLNNFRPGVSARLGIDPATLHARNPDIISLESVGYGRTGPKGDRPGFDMVFQAFCGLEERAGGEGNDPLWSRTSMVDYCQGLMNSIAVVATSYWRLRGGGGADLESSLLGAGLFLTSDYVRAPDGSFQGPPPLDRDRSGLHPAEALYQTADGWVAIAAVDAAMATRLATELGVSDRVPADRADWKEAARAAIADAVRPRSTAQIVDMLGTAEVWVERAGQDGADMLQRKVGVAVTDHALFGRVHQIGALFRLSGDQIVVRPTLPLVGQDTSAILSELGYDAATVERLYSGKIVA